MESMTSSTNARLDGRASARSARRYWRRQFDDTELIDKIGELSAACMVVSKQGRKPREASSSSRLTPSTSARLACLSKHFWRLPTWPEEDGKPRVVGPSYSPAYEEPIPTIRTLGFPKGRKNASAVQLGKSSADLRRTTGSNSSIND